MQGQWYERPEIYEPDCECADMFCTANHPEFDAEMALAELYAKHLDGFFELLNGQVAKEVGKP